MYFRVPGPNFPEKGPNWKVFDWCHSTEHPRSANVQTSIIGVFASGGKIVWVAFMLQLGINASLQDLLCVAEMKCYFRSRSASSRRIHPSAYKPYSVISGGSTVGYIQKLCI